MEDWGIDYFERLLSPSGALQAILLAAGIYFFLTFLKTSRGSGLFRGLVVAVAVIGLGLLGAAKVFKMGELEHILTENYEYVVLILVILFQPELRRGVARLGEQNKLARLLRGERPEAVTEVAAAMIAMAKVRHGALVAFQRNTSLDAWTQNAVRIQSHVDRRLLQGIFQPGGTLHDGAVIIDHDRLVAASCIFPLTENTELHSTIGTRHRAALGLSEETDALTVAVSEETGEISVCESGTMQRDVDPERLEALLRNRLGTDDANKTQEERRSAGRLATPLGFLRAVFVENLFRKVAALLLAGAWLYQAHENITSDIKRTLTLSDEVLSEEGNRTPNTIYVQMLPNDFRLNSSVTDRLYEVEISGPTEEIRLIESRELIGTWGVGEDFKSGNRLEIEDVRFVCGDKPLDDRVKIKWKKGNQPHIDLEATNEVSISLSPSHVPILKNELDSHFEINDQITFNIPKVVVQGPAAQVELLENDALDLRVESPSDILALFEPVSLDAEDRPPHSKKNLSLSQHLVDRGLQLADGTQAVAEVEIVPVNWNLDTIEVELPLVHLTPSSESDTIRWSLVSELKAEFDIQTKAVIPSTESSATQSFKERRAAVRRFVKEHLIVLVDVSELDTEGPDETTTATVKWFWPPPGDWRTLLEEEIGPMKEQATVEVLLKSPIDGKVLLKKISEAHELSSEPIEEDNSPR